MSAIFKQAGDPSFQNRLAATGMPPSTSIDDRRGDPADVTALAPVVSALQTAAAENVDPVAAKKARFFRPLGGVGLSRDAGINAIAAAAKKARGDTATGPTDAQLWWGDFLRQRRG